MGEAVCSAHYDHRCWKADGSATAMHTIKNMHRSQIATAALHKQDLNHHRGQHLDVGAEGDKLVKNVSLEPG